MSLKKDGKVSKALMRRLVADYMYSEGCTCCQDVAAHEAHKKALAEALDVPPYPDGSGYDFYAFREGATARTDA